MFQRQYRLPSSVKLISAKTIHTPFFLVKISANSLPYNRYGFIAGKAIDKRAVIRNRLKRRFRAGIEELHKDLKTGYDLLFILKKSAIHIDMDMQKLHKEAQEILRRQSILI